ncbi:N-6 DNA methylase [Actinoalloteichus fjordicus]|uniref:N-6 DNA Methylase n=1 Tax=Actinoalloteichus fjordicus TaxID=1612552 RepID=A0AAC9LA74_9PSEU|nr:N-6 DNA methylase [Actinoalloteichus fjordicus]APU12629.1 N-6 DNA Methylase [Actinoalloteichus fjordicus]
MNSDATVSTGDIARLVGMGRAAVSNWRRRHDDFPQPVGGTASSPLFLLREVESWLRRHGKPVAVSLGDRVWQHLRARADDLRLGESVAAAGALLLRLRDGDDRQSEQLPGGALVQRAVDADSTRLLAQLAAADGFLGAFEFLCTRYQQAHSRRLLATSDELCSLIARLVLPADGTVLDPACGLGNLLYAVPAGRALGQEIDESSAVITAVRLRLRDVDATVLAGDSLRHDEIGAHLADTIDAVVCDPPFNDRAWGYDELTGDPRWEYGLPPRGEPELAWVQHCLARVRPGGLVAILMPPSAASRRPGRRIRGNLLRAGALRAVVSLGTGMSDLWLLRRPEPTDRAPQHLLLLESDGDFAGIEAAWDRVLADAPSAHDPLVAIIDLLDDDVDVSPARHRVRGTAEVGAEFRAALERFRSTAVEPPALAVLDEQRVLPMTTVGELAKAGSILVQTAPPRMALNAGDVPALTSEDLVTGQTPSGLTRSISGLVPVEPGDVVTAPTGPVRVVADSGAVLGPHLTSYRVDPDRLDPDFLAGFLRHAGRLATSGSSRLDARRVRVPRLPLAEQQDYGRAFRALADLEDSLRQTAELGAALVRSGLDGLADGHLRPG